MSYYVIAEVNVKDDSWVPEYLKNVTQLVHRHGGKYLARTPKIEKLEGERKAARSIHEDRPAGRVAPRTDSPPVVKWFVRQLADAWGHRVSPS